MPTHILHAAHRHTLKLKLKKNHLPCLRHTPQFLRAGFVGKVQVLYKPKQHVRPVRWLALGKLRCHWAGTEVLL